MRSRIVRLTRVTNNDYVEACRPSMSDCMNWKLLVCNSVTQMQQLMCGLLTIGYRGGTDFGLRTLLTCQFAKIITAA